VLTTDPAATTPRPSKGSKPGRPGAAGLSPTASAAAFTPTGSSMKSLGGAIRSGRFNPWRLSSSVVIGACAHSGMATVNAAVNAVSRKKRDIGPHLGGGVGETILQLLLRSRHQQFAQAGRTYLVHRRNRPGPCCGTGQIWTMACPHLRGCSQDEPAAERLRKDNDALNLGGPSRSRSSP
jgi:hypothetical protein